MKAASMCCHLGFGFAVGLSESVLGCAGRRHSTDLASPDAHSL